MLANAGNHTLRASRDKLSRGLVRVYSRVVTNSAWKPPVLVKCKKNASAYKKHVVQSSKVVNERRGVTNNVTLTNRFAILADIQENWGENSGASSSHGNQKGKDKHHKKHSTEHTLPLSHKVNTENTVTEADQEVVTKDRVDEHNNVQSVTIVQSEEYSKMDVTKTNSIVKAVIEGKNCLRHVIVNNIKDKCIDLKTCVRQQITPMGFLPISNLKRLQIASSLKPNVVLKDDNFDPIAVHKTVRSTGKYNFEGAKIQLPSNINFHLLEHLAHDYWDYQLPYFLKFGFPLDFPHEQGQNLTSAKDNHTSAIQYPEHVETYIKTEQDHKAIFGPFETPPYGDNTHVSPFMSRDKPDSENRRIIIDLSWPLEASVNHFTKANMYLSTVYKLQYPTVDNITETLLRLGPEAVIYKIDLSRAFRQLRIDPYDYNLLALKWGSHYFADTFCPFGHRSGSMMYSRLSNFFRYIMFKQNYIVYTYVDDILGLGIEPQAHEAFSYLSGTLKDLGFPISQSKLVSPTTRCNC